MLLVNGTLGSAIRMHCCRHASPVAGTRDIALGVGVCSAREPGHAHREGVWNRE